MALKENLRKYRIEAGYHHIKNFAENILHIKYPTYLSYENKGSWPDEKNLIKICKALHITPNELLGFETPSTFSSYQSYCNRANFKVELDDYDENKIFVLVTSSLPMSKKESAENSAFRAEHTFAFSYPSFMHLMKKIIDSDDTEAKINAVRHNILLNSFNRERIRQLELYAKHLEKKIETIEEQSKTGDTSQLHDGD